jgi:hypothetical protein
MRESRKEKMPKWNEGTTQGSKKTNFQLRVALIERKKRTKNRILMKNKKWSK